MTDVDASSRGSVQAEVDALVPILSAALVAHAQPAHGTAAVAQLAALVPLALSQDPPPSLLHAALRSGAVCERINLRAWHGHSGVADIEATVVATRVHFASAAAAALHTHLVSAGEERAARLLTHAPCLRKVVVLCAAGLLPRGKDSPAAVVAAELRPMVLAELLRPRAHDSKLATVGVGLACACLAVTPLPLDKVAPFLLKCAPAAGLQLVAGSDSAHGSGDTGSTAMRRAFELQRFQLAVDMVTSSAASALPDLQHQESQLQQGASAWGGLVGARPGVDGSAIADGATGVAVCAWVHALLACAVQTLANASSHSHKTAGSSGAASAVCSASEGCSEAAMIAALRRSIDGPLGDIVSALPAAALNSPNFAALAEPATQYLRAAALDGVVQPEAARSARRLWGALYRGAEESAGASAGDSSESAHTSSPAAASLASDADSIEVAHLSSSSHGGSNGNDCVSSSDGSNSSDGGAASTVIPGALGSAAPLSRSPDRPARSSPKSSSQQPAPEHPQRAASTSSSRTAAVAEAAASALQSLLRSDTVLAALFERPLCRCARCAANVASGGADAMPASTAAAVAVIVHSNVLSDDCAALPPDVEAAQCPLPSLLLLTESAPLDVETESELGPRCELLCLLEVRQLNPAWARFLRVDLLGSCTSGASKA